MRIIIALLGAGIALSSVAAPLQAQVRAGVVLDRDGLRNFHLAIGQRYGTHVRVVERYVSPRLHSDEIPVVYLLAHEGRVSPERVISLRERGWSWMDITLHLRVNPRVFVDHLPRQGPPYGNAHGYWRRANGKHLRRLSDRQIVDYVNLAFWAEHYHQPVHEIIVVRERQGSWTRMAGWNASRPPVRRAPVVVAPRRPAIRAPQRGQPERRVVDERAPRYKEAPARGNRGNGRGAPRGRGRGGN